MPETNVAAFWSAVAASCSAIAALGTLLIQRRNFLESVRPELVLIGWDRTSSDGDLTGWTKMSRENLVNEHDVVTIDAIKNVGRGSALHVLCLYQFSKGDEKAAPYFTSLGQQLPIIAPNDAAKLGGNVSLSWVGAISGLGNRPRTQINIHILAWDSHGRKHRTKYSLIAYIPRRDNDVADAIAPGLVLQSRAASTEADWAIKLRARLARVPMLGKIVSRPRS